MLAYKELEALYINLKVGARVLARKLKYVRSFIPRYLGTKERYTTKLGSSVIRRYNRAFDCKRNTK